MTKRTERNAAAELDTKRTAHLDMLRLALSDALAGEKYGAAANFAKQIADLEGLTAPPPPEPARRKVIIHADPVMAARQRLLDVMEMRAAAHAKGSLDSAARLVAAEAELQRELEAATRHAGAAADGELTDDQLIQQVAADLLAMPPAMRRAVLAIVHGTTATTSPTARAN